MTFTITSAHPGDLTLPCGVVVPALGVATITLEQAQSFAGNPVVEHWFRSDMLTVSKSSEDGPDAHADNPDFAAPPAGEPAPPVPVPVPETKEEPVVEPTPEPVVEPVADPTVVEINDVPPVEPISDVVLPPAVLMPAAELPAVVPAAALAPVEPARHNRRSRH